VPFLNQVATPTKATVPELFPNSKLV